MRFTTMLYASPLLLAFGCGGKVIAGGSGGNGGNGGGADTFTACDGPGQCVLVGNSCCGTCGEEDLAGKKAVNGAQADAYFQSVCPDPTPCPACAAQPNPNLFAYCDNGTCRAADVRTHAVSACTSDADCTLRGGTECCQPCMPTDSELTAVNKTSDLSSLVCAPDEACGLCLTQYPPDAAAICNAGHCEVILAGLGGG